MVRDSAMVTMDSLQEKPTRKPSWRCQTRAT